jgi:hypothetical protein
VSHTARPSAFTAVARAYIMVLNMGCRGYNSTRGKGLGIGMLKVVFEP